MRTCNLCKSSIPIADPDALSVTRMGLRVVLCARCALDRTYGALDLVAEVYGEDTKIGEIGAEPAEVHE